MQENKVNTVEQDGSVSLLNIIYRNLFLILLVTIIGLLAGLGVAVFKAKPTYTASKRVMFITKYSEPTDDKGNPINSAGNDMFLAKIYLPNAIDKIRSSLFVHDANDIYENNYAGSGKISASAISARYGEESLIFTLSYTDYSEETALNKLNSVIESAKLNFPKEAISVAKNSTLREVENRASLTKNSNFGKYLFIGAIFGLVLSVAVLVIKEVTDTTIKDRDELERLTGISVLACIDDAEIVLKRKKAKEKAERKRQGKERKSND